VIKIRHSASRSRSMAGNWASPTRRTGRAERRFKSFMWTTRRTWSRRRRRLGRQGRLGTLVTAEYGRACAV
jgi:hypothetical protein